MAAPHPGQVGDLRFHPLHVGKLVADMMDQDFAAADNRTPCGKPLEDRHAQILLDAPECGD